MLSWPFLSVPLSLCTDAGSAVANFAEYVPLALGLLALCEHERALPPLALHGLGTLLCIARYGHGYAFWTTKKWGLGRVGGTVGTMTTIITLAGALMYNALVR